MKELLKLSFFERFTLTILALLMFVLSINGTMALRNILAVVLLFSLFYNATKQFDEIKAIFQDKNLRIILGSLIVFVLYVFIHSIFISHEPSWSLSEFRSQLIYPLAYLLMGILLVIGTKNSNKLTSTILISVVFFAMFMHVIYIDIVALGTFFTDGTIMRRYGGLMDTPAGANYVTNILLAMIIAEIVYRLRTGKWSLRVSNKILYWLLGLTVVATLIETVRLGDITLVFLGLVSSVIFLYKNEKYNFREKSIITTTMFLVLTLPLIYNIQTDPRWVKLTETIPVAMNTAASNMHWRDSSLFSAPIVASGSLAGNSNYMRIAWARQSVHHIRKNPVGIGFGRDAFGHVLEVKYPLRRDMKGYRGMQSHSGILDLALGVGIPGVLLWSLFVYSISSSSFREFKKSSNYFSLLSLFLIMGFYGRSIVDSNMRDHMFLQFMLLLGISLVCMFNNNKNEAK
jgi:hypothetical protein